MIKLQSPNKVEVRPSDGKGMGVFATERIYSGEVIEDCHLLFLPILPNQDDDGVLSDYRFNFPASTTSNEWERQVIPLGFGAIYNHSENNNITWRQHPTVKNVFQFVAIRDIMSDEECCSYYGSVQF